METWLQMALTIIGSVLASGGFWTYLQSRRTKKDGSTELLIGLAHDRIMRLAGSYIKRRWLTQDEYDDLNRYLYRPYKKLGGNGTAARIMKEVEKLPVRDAASIVRDLVEQEERERERNEEESYLRMGEGGSHSGD